MDVYACDLIQARDERAMTVLVNAHRPWKNADRATERQTRPKSAFEIPVQDKTVAPSNNSEGQGSKRQKPYSTKESL